MSDSNSKKWTFRLIAVLLPFIILLLIEGLLRIGGFGKSVPLFIENPQAPSYMLPRPDVVSRYFSDPSAGPNVTVETNFFLKEKPENAVRIFVQGGSTAAGFPFGYGASIAGMLDYRLKQSYLDREVEVVNTAVSAVNSYTLLDFADEIIDQKPDAILIYAGHNEFLGIMGVGSTYSAYNSRGANLLFLKLKDLRLYQLMQTFYDAFKPESDADKSIASQSERQSRTVMAKVARHKEIDVNSPIFKAGLEQFKGNMSLLLAKYKAAGIPVFISTIASNLSHQKPFESHPVSDGFAKYLAKPVEEISPIEQGIIEHQAEINNSADAYFKLGEYYEYKGLFAKAKNAYAQARQHDLLRFRAPMEMNQIIRQLAVDENVTLVDAEAQLSKVAKHNIIGETLMLEHLHPTIKGYFEISDAFYKNLVMSDKLPKPNQVVKRFSALQEMPIFGAEVYSGQAKISKLMADYPFTETAQSATLPPVRNDDQRLGLKYYRKELGWVEVAQHAQKKAQKTNDKIMLMKSSKLLSDAVPNNVEFAYQAGSALIYAQRAPEAFRYLKRALKHEPNHVNSQLALAHASAVVKDYKQAEKWLLSVQKLEPNNQVVKENLPELQKVLKQSN